MRPIALLTDFGLADHYVGVLHAVLEREAPGCARFDLGHGVAAGDVWAASFLLVCSWPHLPADAVVLAVVDPGVGTARRAVAVRREGRWLVAPDNGLAAAAGVADAAVALDWRRMDLTEPLFTFHGRDLFAPAAARLAAGVDWRSLGAEIDPAGLVASPLPEPVQTAAGWRVTVLHVDRFGNVITNLEAERLGGADCLRVGDRALRRVATYGKAAAGEVVALEGSSGHLELAVNGGSAAQSTGLARGDAVEVFTD